jgi:O-antigen/teichoic acid export membrane protein
MITGGFIAGFVLFGKDFVVCWAGKSMEDAWLYVLLILIPNMIPLVQNTCLAILNAMDKRLFRSVILVALTVVNVVLTVVLINCIGPIGAPLATGISYIVGHCIIMNIYYKKKLGLNVGRMFKGIFYKTWFCILISFILMIPTIFWECNSNWMILITKGILFCLVYCILLLLFGMNNDEKRLVRSLMSKIPGLNKLRI